MAKERSVYELNRTGRYMMQMRPVLKKEALFSDGTADYRDPVEPEAGGVGKDPFPDRKRQCGHRLAVYRRETF